VCADPPPRLRVLSGHATGQPSSKVLGKPVGGSFKLKDPVRHLTASDLFHEVLCPGFLHPTPPSPRYVPWASTVPSYFLSHACDGFAWSKEYAHQSSLLQKGIIIFFGQEDDVNLFEQTQLAEQNLLERVERGKVEFHFSSFSRNGLTNR
jgi:hypothetical protein